MLTEFFNLFPAYTIVEQPSPELIARYRSQIPPELLEVWEHYGFGTFCEGYLKVVNPDDYAELLADTYRLTSTPVASPALVLFATAMGDLLIWEDHYLSCLDYRHGQLAVVSSGLDFFFEDLADGGVTLTQELRWEPYLAARARLGEPAFTECFGYVPLLALGGPKTAAHLQRVQLQEHLYLISQFTGVLEH